MMPPWDNKFICHSYFIIKTLQQVIDNENNKKIRQKLKFSKKSARRKCRKNFNHKLFSENFIYDPLNLFPKPMELSVIGYCDKISKESKNKNKYPKTKKKQYMKSSGIEVIYEIYEN